MRIYRNSIIITGLLSIFSIGFAAILNFVTSADAFWCNALLGLFGSGVLTLITSIIGYCVERRRTFEGFSYSTRAILKNINKYQLNWNLDTKVDFFINYHENFSSEWDKYYGDFCFLADKGNASRKYIYDSIYTPIKRTTDLVGSHIWHFRWHQDGSGRNDVVIGKMVKEVEDTFMTVIIEKPDPESEFTMTETRNRLVNDVQNELNGYYYDLMYRKKRKK